MDKRTLAAGILTILFVSALGCLVACSPDARRGGAGGPFGMGRLAVMRGDYEEAIPLLNEYLQSDPRGKHASRAQFFVGKAYIGLGRLTEARIAFNATIDNYPGTLEAHKSRYKLAMITLWEGDVAEARRRFEELADNPDGSLTPEARQMAQYLSAIESRSGDADTYGEY